MGTEPAAEAAPDPGSDAGPAPVAPPPVLEEEEEEVEEEEEEVEEECVSALQLVGGQCRLLF